MNKVELINLTKSLLNESDLSARKEDLLYLKKQYKYFSSKDEDSFYEQEQTKTFISLYNELAKKEPKLIQTPYEEKKEIIELAKSLLLENNIQKASKDLDNYTYAFKNAGKCSNEQDEVLWKEFKSIKDEFYKKRKSYYEKLNKQNEEKNKAKKDIIAKAKELLVIKNIKDANKQMDELMEEWKKIGYSGKDNNESLWEEFLAVRKEFQVKKKEKYEELTKVFEERAKKKEEMIVEMKKLLLDAYFTEEEVQKVKKMRQDFNHIGFAGKEKDEELYQKFDEIIKQYFDEKKFYTI